MINIAVFKTRFPEFSSIDDTIIQMLLDEAYIFIKDNQYQDTLILYFTAHNLVVQQSQASGNNSSITTVASESVGSVSTSYATPQSDNSSIAFYNSTSYGQKYLEYKRALCIGNVRLV